MERRCTSTLISIHDHSSRLCRYATNLLWYTIPFMRINNQQLWYQIREWFRCSTWKASLRWSAYLCKEVCHRCFVERKASSCHHVEYHSHTPYVGSSAVVSVSKLSLLVLHFCSCGEPRDQSHCCCRGVCSPTMKYYFHCIYQAGYLLIISVVAPTNSPFDRDDRFVFDGTLAHRQVVVWSTCVPCLRLERSLAPLLVDQIVHHLALAPTRGKSGFCLPAPRRNELL